MSNPDYTRKRIFGTAGDDAAYYGVLNKQQGDEIRSADWKLVEAAVNQERVRRGAAANAVISTRFEGFIEAADLNYLKSAVEVAGVQPNPAFYKDEDDQPVLFTRADAYTSGFQGVLADRLIDNEEINAMVDKVNSAGAVCVCNCNYCTCNCNYCTCNCNYSCTCNCNYSSDIRLKTNINLIDIVSNLNVYSFSYIWDTSKTFIGVMAQELIGTIYESSLSKDKNGYYMVDYSKLPVKMEVI